MARLIGLLGKTLRLLKQLLLMHLALEDAGTLCICDFLARALNTLRRAIVSVRSLVDQKIRFYLYRHEWHPDTKTGIFSLTSMIAFER